jgi:hypothetical protein
VLGLLLPAALPARLCAAATLLGATEGGADGGRRKRKRTDELVYKARPAPMVRAPLEIKP